VRTCIIFNPAARGEKARRLRRHLDEIGTQATLKLTASAGDARRLACEAVGEGFDTVVAAGGDGTLNEVLNGIGDAPNGFERARLGLLPLGTVNVFAREIAFPTKFELAWQTIQRGKERQIDLPCVEHDVNGSQQRRYFAQLAGAGLDARAIELVKWQIKKAIGPFAYVLAGLHAVLSERSKITATCRIADSKHEQSNRSSQSESSFSTTGELVMVGNGRLYGGDFKLFPGADLNNGLLEVCVLPRANLMTLFRCAPSLLLMHSLPASAAKLFQTENLTLTSDPPAPLEVDGELIGRLPAKFSIKRDGLRVIVP